MDPVLIPSSAAAGQTMNVVVAGGAGFVGSNLVDRLVSEPQRHHPAWRVSPTESPDHLIRGMVRAYGDEV